MATEGDVPEAVSIVLCNESILPQKGEAVDRSLTIEQLYRTVDQCSPVELNKSKGDLDQHYEIHSEVPYADGENVQVDYSMKVESKNNSFGISEGEHFLDPLSEISQADQSSQAGREIPKSVQLQKGTQVGGSVQETCTEARKEKFEKDIENHDTVNAAGIISEMAKTGDANLEVEEVEASTNETTVDQHVQVISNQQDSIKESVQYLEQEDIKGAEKGDGNAESYRKEATDLLEATTFQEYEAPSSTLDFTNDSFKKDTELETNVSSTPDTNPTLHGETSTKVTSNVEEDSQQTLQNYEPKEELQKLPEVVPEDSKTESATENAVVSCTEEARTIRNTTEFLEKEEAPLHCAKENDIVTEEVFEATSTEQETAEHALPEIHAAENHPQEKIEEEIQTAEGEGERDLKYNAEGNKESVDNAGIAPEECLETITTDQPALHIEDIELKAEENVDSKDKLEEQIPTSADEGGDGWIEAQTETNKQVTDTDIASEAKGLETTLTDENAPLEITDIDVEAEKDSNSKENLEKQVPVVADEGDPCLKEAEEEKEQEALPPISTGELPLDIEVINVQAEENFSPEEKLEELIPAVADECDTGLKEAEEENKEQVKVADSAPEEKVAILTEDRALDNEEIEQVKENVSSIDNMEKHIPTTAEEGDTGLKELEEDNKEPVSMIDISPEEKGLATILTDETTHEAEDTDVKPGEYISSKDIEGESCSMEPQEEDKEKVTYTDITHEAKVLNSEEKLEEQAPVVADEGDTGLNEAEEENKEQIKSEDAYTEEKGLPIISTYETALESEEVELQSEENVSSIDNLEKQIPTTADETEQAEAEKEQATITDSTPERVSAQTILTSSEEIKLLAEEIMNSADCMEKQISTVADEGEDILMEAESENKEQPTLTDISPEEKGVATISTDERALETEETNVQAEESANSDENLEEEISAAPKLGDTCVKEDEEENKEVRSSDRSQEEKGQDTEDTDVQAGEDFKSEDTVEKQIPAAVYEYETDSKEVEAEYKEQVEVTEIAPENAEAVEVIDVQAMEIKSKEDAASPIPTASDEGETELKEAEADIKEQVETTDIVPEQKGVETISSEERALDLEDVDVQAQESFISNENSEGQMPQTVDEGETDLNEGEAENKELVEKATEEQSYPAISHEEVEQKIAVEDEKTEDHPEENQEVLDEPKITSRDVSEEQIIECNVASCTPEPIEEDTVKSSQENEKETEELKEDGSCIENTKEENASDLTQEYVPEDDTEQNKDEDYNAVKSENEIVEDSQTVEVDESTTCETKNVESSEEILSTLPAEYDEVVQQGEDSNPTPTEALKDDDGDNGAVTVTETSAKEPSNEEEDSPQVLQKYEPEEEITKLPDVKPEETTPKPSSENAEVIPCTEEEIQESLDKENDTSSGEASIEATELSTEGEKGNSEDQTTREVSSSLIGEETTEESSKEEEKNEVHVECKDSIEEEKSETLEDTTDPKPALEEESKESLAEDRSLSSELLKTEIEKEIQGGYSSTVGSFDSEVVSDQTGSTEAKPEDKELVETTHIAPEEKDSDATGVFNTELVAETIVEPSFQVKTLEEEAAPKLEVEGETEKSDDLPEKDNKICEEVPDEPKITERDINEEQIIEENVTILATEPVEEQETVKDYQGKEKETEKLIEEESSIENITEGNSNDNSTECVPEDKDEELKEHIEEAVESKEQIIEGNVTSYTPESIEDDTVKSSQDSEKETIELKEEGNCAESIKEENASELSTEYIRENEENGGDNFKDDKEESLMSEEKILEDSQTVGVTESTTCETSNVERSEATLSTLPVEYAEGSSPAPTEASKQENIAEDTYSVEETTDNDGDAGAGAGAATVTETTAEGASNDEDESPQVLQKYETDLPEEKPSSENAEAVTCTKEETQESLQIEKDFTLTGEACVEAAELSTEGEKEEQTTEEVSSSLKGDETTEESLKEEEKKEAHEECKEVIEGTEEESDRTLAEDGEVSEKVIEKESATVRSSDCEDVSDERGLTEATQQVETTHIAPEMIEPSSQVQTVEETEELQLEVEDETDKSDDLLEKSNRICEEVLDEPKITDRDFHEEQVTEGNAASCASESVEEETVKDYQADEKDVEKSNEEDSSTENIKEDCVNVISIETIPEVIVEEYTGEVVESKQEILQESQEESFPIKVAGDNDDCNDTVVLSGAGAEVTSTGEVSSEVTQMVELGENHTQVETSDVADEIEVRDLEDKVSIAGRTEEETKKVQVSDLALEKQDTGAPEVEAVESSEVVPESDSKSTEVIADQTLNECISEAPSALLSEVKELKASEDEHAKEVEVPTEEDRGDISAERSAEETCLPKEEPRELNISELALEKLDARETEEETKETSESIGVACEDKIITDQTQCEGEKEQETSEIVQEILDAEAPEEETKDGSAMDPKLDSASTNELVKEEIIADQAVPEDLPVEQLPIPSTALLPEEKELEASEHEHETTNVDKYIEEENPKEVEVPADENKLELAATATETCLHTEEPSDAESALHKPDAGETEEERTYGTVTESDSQSLVVPTGDETVADQTLSEGVTDTPISEESHWRAYELALEKLHAEDTEKNKESAEIVPECDSVIIEVVSCDATTIDQTLNEGIVKEQIQSPSSTLLPEEKEHETSDPEPETTAQEKSTEQECAKEVEVSADEGTEVLLVAKPVEEECLQKEEPSEFNVFEDANETYGTVSGSDFPSITADPKEEITADEALSKGVTDIPLEIPSYSPIQEEREPKASELDLVKLVADTSEEETIEGSEVIPQSVSQSSCEVSKDEIIADQLETPTSAPLPDDKELKASEHDHEAVTDDKNIVEEKLKEVGETMDEATEDVFAARSVEETCLKKEEPSELKVPELAQEKLETEETEEVKETFETVSKSDAQSINAVLKGVCIADQTLPAAISDLPLDIPSHTSLPMETEEVKEDATELAQEKLDADATQEVKKGAEVTTKSDLQSIDAALKDKIIADQVLHEGITKEELLIQSSTLLPEEKELKDTEHEHGVATQDNNLEEEYVRETEVIADKDTKDEYVASSEEKTLLQKEEPRELKVSELSPEIVGEEEITATSESTDAVFKEETISEQALPPQHDKQLQVAPPTLLPSEKDKATVQKEELEDCKGLELSPKGESEEETKEAYESGPEVSLQSIGELPRDEIVDQIPPSLISEKRCEITTTIKNAGEESMNGVEKPNDQSRKDTYSAEETSIPIEVARELNVSDLEFPPSHEAKKNEASNEEKNIEVATSDLTAGDSCETTIEGNQTAKIELSIEEMKDEKEVAKDSQLISVGGENIRESQQENESRAQEKYPEEKNDTFIAPREYHHEVPEVEKTGSVSRDIETQVKPDDKSSTGPSNDTLVARETKEEVFCESGTETADSTSAQTSLSERLMEESTKERMKVVTHLTEEKESSVGKEPQADEEEDHEDVEKAKTDEEKEDAEHKRAYHGYDEPVMVEASGDTEMKVTPKKSHNILSGMGKSVKHSISKVKKAIIGKSSNSKTQSEK